MTQKKKKSGQRRKAHTGEKVVHRDTGTPPFGRRLVTTVVARVTENKEVITYVALFVSLCLMFYLIYYYLTLKGSLSVLKNVTALVLGTILSVGGATVIVNGATLSVNGFGLEIIDECTAVFSSIVYCACILAYPTTLKNKGVGIVFGIPSLYAINILRLFVLTLVGISAPHLFDVVHVYLWQASFIIFVVVIFLLWLRVVVK